MTDTRGAPIALALDPTQVRPKPTRSSAARLPRWALVGGGVGLALIAGFGAGAFWFKSEPARPRRADIRVGPLEDMPEIRNGVPELVRKVPARTIAIAPPPANEAAVTSSPSADTVRAAEGPVASNASSILPAAARPDIVLPPPPPVDAAASVLASAAVAANPVAPSRSAAGMPAPMPTLALLPPASDPATPPPVVGAPSPPLPPPAPIRTVGRTEPAPERAAVAAPRQRSAAAPASPQPARMPPPPSQDRPEEDDHVEVLGLKVPTLGAAGRRIRDGASSVVEAVKSVNPF